MLAVMTAACAPQNQVELNLAATNVVLSTEIAHIRNTATAAADNLQITVEYIGTQAAQSERQNGQLQATLIARGEDPAALSNINAQVITPLPTIGQAGNDSAATLPEVTPNPNDVAVTPFGTQEVAQDADTGTPALANIVMSSGVGSDDCAQGTTSTFAATDERIYVVATALNISPGTTITARYQVGGQEVAHTFTPDFAIDENCIWFYMDQTDAPFTPGNWSVQLELNGVSAAPAVPFSITE